MVDRKIVFYRWQSVSAQNSFVPYEVAERLDLAVLADESRSLLVGRDSATAVHVLRYGDPGAPTRFQLLAVRHEGDQPVEWSPGQTVRSLMMSEGHYTADVTYVCVWPDGYAAQDWYTYTPRLSRLANFLRNQLSEHVAFNTLYRPDMMTKLDQIRGHLRSVDMALTSPEFADVDRAGTLGAFIPAIFGHAAPSLSVKIGMGRYGPRKRYLNEVTEEAIFQIAENAQEMVDRLIISGYDPRSERVIQVNLLKERIGQEISVDPNPEAATLPDEEAIFEEIVSARQALEDEGMLERAAEAQAMRAS